MLRTGYEADGVEWSTKHGVSFDPDEGRTQQNFRDECDINVIVERFGLTGELPQSLSVPQSGDFSGVTDYHSAMNVVAAADAAFMELPGALRARFENDPGRLLAFLNDEKNRAEAVELGLVVKPPEKTRDVVQAVDELAAKIVAPK